jgi:hypothetical protein
MACVNKNIPGRTKKEYRDEHKKEAKDYVKNNQEKIKQTKREHYDRNKEKIKARAKAHHKANREANLEKMKARYHDNDEVKEKAKARAKAHYLKNKARNSEKITCECGAEVTRRSMPRHKTTKTHKNAMGEEEKEEKKIEISEEDLQIKAKRIADLKKLKYQKNKDKILAKGRERVTCECGKTVCRSGLTRHKKTKYHLDNI